MDEQLEHFECSLSAVELEERRKAWEALAAARFDAARTQDGFRVRFRGEPGIRASLGAVVAAERDCCGWARWEVTHGDDSSVVEVTGPPGRVETLASAFGI